MRRINVAITGNYYIYATPYNYLKTKQLNYEYRKVC
jgi:hypothetical protein